MVRVNLIQAAVLISLESVYPILGIFGFLNIPQVFSTKRAPDRCYPVPGPHKPHMVIGDRIQNSNYFSIFWTYLYAN